MRPLHAAHVAAHFVAVLILLPVLAGCSGTPDVPSVPGAPEADLAMPLRGVLDPGADPAVVLLAIDGQPFCTGTLLESDVVLTARRCVDRIAGNGACPASGAAIVGPRDPSTIHVLTGDDVSSALPRASARDVSVPPGVELCGADLALLLLDTPIDDIAPVPVSPTGAAQGDHVRTVAYGPAEKLVRDHVLVSETSPRELAIEQASCVGLPGGAVIDATGAMVGVVSRGDPQCGASSNWEVATRPDAFAMLIDATLAQGTVSHATHQAKEKKGAIDQGASCETASQCAAGACVTYAGAQYCTRLCDPTDRCPSLTRCMTAAEMTSDIGTDTPSQQSTSVCVAE